MKRYSVSLVFQNQKGEVLNSALRVMHVEASSNEEALGKGIVQMSAEKDLKGYSLSLRVVLEITPEQQ